MAVMTGPGEWPKIWTGSALRSAYSRWSMENIRTLERWYGVVPTPELAAQIGVTVRALQEQARRLGISARINREVHSAPWEYKDRMTLGEVAA